MNLRVALQVVVAVIASLPLIAVAQHYPSRPVRVIVPTPPGGSMDAVVRLIGENMARSLGQPVVVENRPGAGTVVGVNAAAKAAPDGYTLVCVATSFAANHTLVAKLPYDSRKDFQPVASLTREPHILAAHPAVPARDLRQLLAYARANPGKLSYGSPGNGTGQHLAFELLKSNARVDILHVPYSGTVAAMADVMSGQVDLAMGNPLTFVPQVRAGKLRGLAVSSVRRSPMAADIPTIAEQGLPGFETYAWFGLLAPAGVPDAIVFRLNGEIRRVLGDPDVRSTLAGGGQEPMPRTPQEYGRFLDGEIVRYAKVIKAAKITTD
ncbi:MAG TPA: tripartite tricarboxylate transporter substrate binding protein [Burkholderiales bacterium]|nr:tripartite tricarboxylate transporter substrate binding protein [Burkholderiales bacterium]